MRDSRKEVAEAFVSSLKISYPVLLDTYSVTAKAIWGGWIANNLFILDRNGVVRERYSGETDRESFERDGDGIQSMKKNRKREMRGEQIEREKSKYLRRTSNLLKRNPVRFIIQKHGL